MPLTKPLIISAGEPAGIGPDLVLQYATRFTNHPWLAIGDPALFYDRAKDLNIPIKIKEASPHECGSQTEANQLWIQPTKLNVPCKTGELNPDNSEYVLNNLKQATAQCLANECSGIVTAPIHKGVINQAGVPFTGHTEMLAELTSTDHVVMMLVTGDFRVALMTTHIPLRDVPDSLTAPLLTQTIQIVNDELKAKFGVKFPSIKVCGLNPHAGEQGYIGTEEIDVMQPVLDILKEKGLAVSGPYPADTLFTPQYMDNTDAFLALYHDQGLPVLKHAGFGKAVNVTLGLPIVRTSVDHGTAIDLAGSGRADGGSFRAAMDLAKNMANHHKHAKLRELK